MNDNFDLLEEKSSEILRNGYVTVKFADNIIIKIIQENIRTVFGFDPTLFHQKNISEEDRLHLTKKAKDLVVQKELVRQLFLDNLKNFIPFVGLDIDIQSDIHLRISRPNQESDFVDWHRDTFNGNSYWELNVWFPIFPLEAGSGLSIVEASHLLPASNVRYIEDKNDFRKTVLKGSIANELGYVYAPKVDDVISQINFSQTKLLSPKVGEAIVFFGHAVHRAQNASDLTRVSVDIRIKNAFSPTNTKSGYYQPLARSTVAQYAEKMQNQSELIKI